MVNLGRAVSLIIAVLLLAGNPQPMHGASQNTSTTVQPRTLPPKEVMRLLMKLQDVPLATSAGCSTTGTNIADLDVGDYISGWLVELKQGAGTNWIEASGVVAETAERLPGWKCVVMFRSSMPMTVGGGVFHFSLDARTENLLKHLSDVLVAAEVRPLSKSKRETSLVQIGLIAQRFSELIKCLSIRLPLP